MNNITMREISAEKEELLNRRVQKLNGLPSKKKKSSPLGKILKTSNILQGMV